MLNWNRDAAGIAANIDKVGFRFPFLAIPVFLASDPLYRLLALLGFGQKVGPHFGILQDQYLFLTTHGVADRNLAFDFQIFEFFIVIATGLCVAKLCWAVIAPGSLASFDALVARAKAKHLVVHKGILHFIIGGAVGMFFSTNFSAASSAPQIKMLMLGSPRTFICFCTILFCTCEFFFVYGLLFAAFLVRRRL